MALVDSDLFLVQDATTKTNYKVTLSSLTSSVADEISYDNIYVNDSGDNMTGDLTLGPTNNVKITLSALTGDANFTGTVYANYLRVANTLTGTGGLTIYGDSSSTKGLTINSDGSIDIDGDVTANAFIGDGSGLTNLPLDSLWVETNDTISPVNRIDTVQCGNDPTTGLAGVSFTTIGQINATESGAGKVFTGRQTGSLEMTSWIQGDGSATFNGPLEALSIDGGTYS